MHSELKRTPLYGAHVAAKARMVDFGGWEMPVQYSGLVDEHNAVRKSVGIFDVSHMGEIDVRGKDAERLVQYVTSNDVAKLKVGQAHYSALMNENGGFVDDILVHKVAPDHIFLCVNASNQEKDFEYIRSNKRFDADVEFSSPKYAQIAIQGANARATLQKLTGTDLSAIRYYWFVDGEIEAGVGTRCACRIAHTGYTGEDGFEIYVAPEHAVAAWNRLLEAGAEFDIKPCGLGARNTLRLEAKMALYGHEIDAETTPLEADLAWIVKIDKGEFVGREALQRTPAKKLVGFEMRGRGIGRDGYAVVIDGDKVGAVTSGGPSPTLNKNIGLAYVPPSHTEIGTKIQIVVRDVPVDAEVVPTPFYKRPKS